MRLTGNLSGSMASWGNLMLFLASLAFLSGCAQVNPLLDKGKDYACVVEDGQYVRPKEKVVEQFGGLIKKAAEAAGQNISDEDAQKVAEEMLKPICKGSVPEPIPEPTPVE